VTFRDQPFWNVRFHFSKIHILVWRRLKINWGRCFVFVLMWYSHIRYDMNVKVYPDSLLNNTAIPNDTYTLWCFKISCFVLYFSPVLLPHSFLSLEAKTWRRTASPALSATDRCVEVCVWEINELSKWNEGSAFCVFR